MEQAFVTMNQDGTNPEEFKDSKVQQEIKDLMEIYKDTLILREKTEVSDPQNSWVEEV